MRNTPGIVFQKRFFLIDCNNFFVSCEQVFNPKLVGKPVVVLSNNDGCVISRSQEAKDIGIKMGVPLFKVASMVKQHQVHVLSSNFSLYADMSARVMHTLTSLAEEIEIYSIDEAFLFILYTHDSETYGRLIKSTVRKHTGISISVGIGPTKTLAKVANKLAKKRPDYKGVFDITDHPDTDALLESLPVRDVWGVGYRFEKMLINNRIKTIKDFKYASDAWVQKKMTIVGLKTLHEMRGISCLDLVDQQPAKQSITVSRSFGKLVSEKKDLAEAVATYTISAARKLRREKRTTSILTVFIATSRHGDHEQYQNSVRFSFPVATSYTPHLLEAALVCLNHLFKKGYFYKKTGVMLTDLTDCDQIQLNLFTEVPDTMKHAHLMKTIDDISGRFGSHVLTYASAGQKQSWKAKRLLQSPRFTTSWHELFTV